MGIFNLFSAMAGQIAAKQERSQVATALIRELKDQGKLAELAKKVPDISTSKLRSDKRRGYQGMVVFSQRVNVPVGPSGSCKTIRTISREPSSAVPVPA